MARGEGSGVTSMTDRLGDEMLIAGLEGREKKELSGSGRVT